MAMSLLRAPARWARRDAGLRRCWLVSVAALWVVGALDASDGSIGRWFDVAVVAVAVTAALAVEPAGRWTSTLLPLAALPSALLLLVLTHRDAVEVPGLSAGVGRPGHALAAVLDHGEVLAIACAAAALVAVVLRRGSQAQPVASST